ncbi:MAG: HAAAP family serine/threonine permease [Candidatus Symbiodolus clandestinus]
MKHKILTADEQPPSVAWNQSDTHWTLTLFGTAVGAGILFLPINAGLGGFWPLLLLTLLVGPMTYWAHLGLCRLVLSASQPDSTLSEVVTEHFGIKAGKLITLLYFLSIYPILLIYGVGITNTLESFIKHQLGLVGFPRAVLAFIAISTLMLLMQFGERWILKINTCLVYPLVAILLGISCYLIPYWRVDFLYQLPALTDFISAIWLTTPLLVFSFNHSPAIAYFSVAQRRRYGLQADYHARRILQRTSLILLLFVMFFVFSTVLTLSPESLKLAKQQNLSILSFLANQHSSYAISYLGPLIAFLAITSSFFGHYQGAYEGLKGLLPCRAVSAEARLSQSYLERGLHLFFFLSLWGVALLNPSILGMIESLSGPVIALILLIMPVYARYHIPALARYIHRPSDGFILLMGTIAISALIYSLLQPG